jgi:ArsR family transcriptional regulator, arsenate/arsenite/antimonite-responsive transcriptional repressor / arsenate reductase (thioredoxin)
MRELALGDRRVRELTAAVRQPQNLVSYHLRQLRTAGLVTSRRSSFDGRDTYYSADLDGCAQALAASASALHPGLAQAPAAAETAAPAELVRRKVLFVCTGNTGRSPMAEALLRHQAGTHTDAASAGIHPKPLRQEAVSVMWDRYRIDITGHRPTRVETAAHERFDFVITLCDKAREHCPEFPGHPGLIHWSMPDPAAAEGEQAGYPAFDRTAAELETRIRFFLPVLQGITPIAGQLR